MKQFLAFLLLMAAPRAAVCQAPTLEDIAQEDLTILKANTNVFTRALREPQFNFYMLDVDTAAGADTTCVVLSTISAADLKLAIRYEQLPDAYGVADCKSDVNGDVVGSNAEGCTAKADAAKQERLYVQVVVVGTSTVNTATAIDIRCEVSTPAAPTPSPTTAPSSSCFSGEATVDVLDKGVTQMKDLQVGDHVVGLHGISQPVYAMAHVEEDKMEWFLEIETEYGMDGPLEITGDHLVFVDGKAHPVRADSLAVGDNLVLGGEIYNATTRAAPITKIDSVYKQGLYAPLTPDGTMVVNGVMASSYVSLMGDDFARLENGYPIISWHGVVQMYLSPIRLVCLGPFSSQFCHFSYDETTGFTSFVTVGFKLLEWWNQQSLLVQLASSVGLAAVWAPFLAMEYLLMRGVLLASVVCAASWAVLRKKKA